MDQDRVAPDSLLAATTMESGSVLDVSNPYDRISETCSRRVIVMVLESDAPVLSNAIKVSRFEPVANGSVVSNRFVVEVAADPPIFTERAFETIHAIGNEVVLAGTDVSETGEDRRIDISWYRWIRAVRPISLPDLSVATISTWLSPTTSGILLE